MSAWGSTCPQLYPKASPIEIKGSQELCSSFYVSLYDESHRAVRLVSEYLDPNAKVGSVNRVNIFRADDRVKNPVRPLEYVGTGFDKGHFAPAEDSSTDDQMRDTFLMTNMSPQSAKLNRGPWKGLENQVRKLAAGKQTWVLTIPIYTKPQYVSNIPIPSGYWKIVYLPSTTKYFFAPNSDSGTVREFSAIEYKKILASTSF